MLTYTDAGWTTRPDGTSQGGQLVFRVAARQRVKHVSDILAFESIEMGGKIFVCSRNSSSGGDDEAVYIRLCLKEVLFGQLDLRNWQSEARQIPALALRPLVWLETQEIWLGSTCAQTESRGVWNNNTLVSFCGTAG